jgi:hypothetical protein
VLRIGVTCLALCLGSCLNFRKVDDAKAPGDLLGVYQVKGELAESTCGKGALGSADSWSFEVKLSRMENDIYWLNGKETIVGDIASDGRSFSIVSQVQVTVAEAGRGKSGCKVLRQDTAKGKLSDDGAEVESFDGTLAFSYQAMAGSDCSEWVGSVGAVANLPCELSYDIEAERSAEE